VPRSLNILCIKFKIGFTTMPNAHPASCMRDLTSYKHEENTLWPNHFISFI